jgi:membrane-associated phospholipid phosphatase
MTKTLVNERAICSGLLLAIALLGVTRPAQSQEQEQQRAGPAEEPTFEPVSERADTAESTSAAGVAKSQKHADEITESRLGLSLLKNITLDEKAILTSPTRWRLVDADWLIPIGAIAAASLVSDTHFSRALTRSTIRVNKSAAFSNYGVAAFGGIAGGIYLLGKITNDDRKREAGLLSAEAAVDAVGVSTALQYAFGRQRPADGNGGGGFWRGGTSFPSDHSTAAWAVASVIAHEYPGPLTKLLAYGLASAVSASRVSGKDHFPTDVIAGAAIGWFVGQHVYRAHHDPDLGGESWNTFSERRAEGDGRNFKNTGSPYVPLDSWIYPNIDRLIALGYIHSAFQDVRPLTRLECAALVQEAGENIADGKTNRGEGDRIYAELQNEFQSEFSVIEGEGKQQSVRIESLYSNVTAISGPPLNDSYHFGQTIIDNSGRPYQEGFNTYDGFSAYGTAGRYAIYVRGEFQGSPSGPALPLAARQAVATADQNPLQPATPVSAVSQFALLDAYVSANVGGWEFSVGKQSLWWGRGVGGALMLSDNAEPMYMFRARPTESIKLPSIFRWLGPIKSDFFVGQLAGNEFPARPLIHGLKLTAKMTRDFEISLSATSEFGGVGRPITFDAILNSFFSVHSSDTYPANRNPGKRTIGGDLTFTFPPLRNWLTVYANGLLPEANNTPNNSDPSPSSIHIFPRLAIRSGIYMPRVPKLPKLDFRVEAVYTDAPTDRSISGRYVYWNDFYHDLYVNKNKLIGDWVGREGMGFQGWSTYWFSPRKSIQLAYRHAKVSGDFIPGGETVNDGSANLNWTLRDDWSVSAGLQYEKWLAPILAPGPQTNWTSSVSVTFWPRR